MTHQKRVISKELVSNSNNPKGEGEGEERKKGRESKSEQGGKCRARWLASYEQQRIRKT
jgi:hypothetical protein